MAKNPVHYSRSVAQRFCNALATSENSLSGLLRNDSSLPCASVLYQWRDKYPAFARAWKRAREMQAEHLMQKCFDLAAEADKTNAHAMRVKFDIYKFYASKVLPALYGDKPSETSVNVSTAVVISPERLNALRGSLERARSQITEVTTTREKQKERRALYPPSLVEHDNRGNGSTEQPRKQGKPDVSPLPLMRNA